MKFRLSRAIRDVTAVPEENTYAETKSRHTNLAEDMVVVEEETEDMRNPGMADTETQSKKDLERQKELPGTRRVLKLIGKWDSRKIAAVTAVIVVNGRATAEIALH